jgi:hypothetical protein
MSTIILKIISAEQRVMNPGDRRALLEYVGNTVDEQLHDHDPVRPDSNRAAEPCIGKPSDFHSFKCEQHG